MYFLWRSSITVYILKDVWRLTLKKVMVEPSLTAPYSILVCLARSSAESIGESILSTVRKAARLAVYDEMMMRVKNHQMPPTILVDKALGISSDPVHEIPEQQAVRNETYLMSFI